MTIISREVGRFFGVRSALWLAVVTAAIVGCGGSKTPLAPVSGLVTVEGAPVADAKVVFMPMRSGDSDEAGYNSVGRTDADGRYRLTTAEKNSQDGAAIGTHRVMITTKKLRADPSDPDKTIVDQRETIPKPYNSLRSSPLRFEVPAKGTDAADFAIE